MADRLTIFCTLVNGMMAAYKADNGIKLQQLEAIIIDHYSKGRITVFQYDTLIHMHHILIAEWRKRENAQA